MAIVICKDLQKSFLSRHKPVVHQFSWTIRYSSTKAWPKTREFGLCQYIHTPRHGINQGKLGITGTNRRWTSGHSCNMWRLQGNNPQENALKEPLGDVVLNPERFRYQHALVVLRILKHYLRAQSQGHHTIDRLQERGVETGSIQRSTLKGREKAIVEQTNIGTVS